MYNAILFSGGVNDIVGEPFMLWIRERRDGMPIDEAVDRERLDSAISVVLVAVEEFVEVCEAERPGVPIFLNAYDFAYPNNTGFCLGVGPWLAPGLRARGWSDGSEGRVILKAVLKQFRAGLDSVVSNHSHVHVVETQGAIGDKHHWDNELHPTGDGFRVIAKRFADALLEHAEPA